MIFKLAARGDLFVLSDDGKMLWSPYGPDAYDRMAEQVIAYRFSAKTPVEAKRHCLVMSVESKDTPFDQSDWRSFILQIINAQTASEMIQQAREVLALEASSQNAAEFYLTAKGE